MPLDATEMKAYLAYMKWLSTGIPDGAKLIGAGMKGIKEPSRAADLGNGAKVFIDTAPPATAGTDWASAPPKALAINIRRSWDRTAITTVPA